MLLYRIEEMQLFIATKSSSTAFFPSHPSLELFLYGSSIPQTNLNPHNS